MEAKCSVLEPVLALAINSRARPMLRFSFPLSIALAAAAYIAWRVFSLVWKLCTSSLRHLRGPKSQNWLLGNLREMYDSAQWVEWYGETFRFKGILGSDALFTTDTKALHHILYNTARYRLPGLARSGISDLIGEGLLLAEGVRHRNQRRVMNPAFGPAQIRELTEIFLLKSIELAQLWGLECEASGGRAHCLDVVGGLSKTALDIIGLAGFDYAFDSLNVHGEPNELNQAFDTIFRPGMAGASLFRLLKLFFPSLGRLPVSGTKELRYAKGIMRKIGMRLIHEKREALSIHGNNWQEDRRQRDLLTLLIQGNADPSIPEHERLSDEDILAQIPTFLVAGHETTSNATAWALYSLSTKHDAQTKLREECLSIPTDHPGMNDLNNLPYLDCVVRETLRLHTPLNSTTREAIKEDLIPLSKPYVDVYGRLHDHVRVDKGCLIQIPMLAQAPAHPPTGERGAESQ